MVGRFFCDTINSIPYYVKLVIMLNSFKKIKWTEHAKLKMRQYGLSKSKLMNVLQKPERKEQGIAGDTIALMQTKKILSRPSGAIAKNKPPGEIWLMYQDNNKERKIISAWRYPGISKPGESIPIPKDILRQLEKEI